MIKLKKDNLIELEFNQHNNLVRSTYIQCKEDIEAATYLISDGFKSQPKKKLFLFGNGGSAADAQHIAAEFTNRYSIDREPLPAIALTTDTSTITAISNDFGYGEIFEKQIKALAQPGDIALGISTSGTSGNVITALYTAKVLNMKTILLTGDIKNDLPGLDAIIKVPSPSTPRIQEMHILIGHIICMLIDEEYKIPIKKQVTNNKVKNMIEKYKRILKG